MISLQPLSQYIKKVWRLCKAHWHVIVLLILPLIALGPTLKHGYILQYDMVFVPHPSIDWMGFHTGNALYSNLPIQGLMQILGHIFPMDIVQKCILWGILFGASASIYFTTSPRSRIARLLGGIAYAYNPFTFDRLMAGQWLFLAGYALLPLLLYTFIKTFRIISKKHMLHAALVWTMMILLSPHFLAIGCVLFLAVAFTYIRSLHAAGAALGILVATALLNLWWLIPSYTGTNITHGFTASDFYVFASKPDAQYGIWFTLLSMQGFWHVSWQNIRNFMILWPIIVILWLIPVFSGIAMSLHASQKDRKWTGALILAGLIGLIFAVGPMSWVGPFNVWVYSHIPGMTGLRESQKLLCLLVLAYSIFFVHGITVIDAIKKNFVLRAGLYIITATITLCVASPFFWGARGQMHVSQYSPGWRQLELALASDATAKVLILPWSIYIDHSFIGQLTANPAPAYFASRQISSNRAELAGVSDYPIPANASIQQAIDSHDSSALQIIAAQRHIRYIFLVKSIDDSHYVWLLRSNSFKVFHSDSEVVIFQLT